LNLFVKNINTQHLPISLEEQLIDIREDGHLLAQSPAKPLQKLWKGQKNEYRNLVTAGNDALLPLRSTHLREASFSAMTPIKTTY